MRDKALQTEENEAVVRALKEVRERDFAGKSRPLALALGISDGLLSEILAVNATRQAGMKVLRALSKYTGKSIDELTGGTPSTSTTTERRPLGNGALGDHPMWTETIEVTRRRYGKRLTEEMIEKLERASLSFTPERLTPDFLYTVAEAIEESEPFEDPS